MEPLNDDELNALLRQWNAPGAPPRLERMIFPEPKRGAFAWLFASSIRVPVPVAAIVLLALAAALFYPRGQSPKFANPPELRMSDFQPVAELKPRVVRRVP